MLFLCLLVIIIIIYYSSNKSITLSAQLPSWKRKIICQLFFSRFLSKFTKNQNIFKAFQLHKQLTKTLVLALIFLMLRRTSVSVCIFFFLIPGLQNHKLVFKDMRHEHLKCTSLYIVYISGPIIHAEKRNKT